MKSHARLALVLASIASTFAATSAHAGITGGGTGGGILTGGGHGIDVIGTGQSFNKTWTLIDYDAKRLALVTYLNPLNEGLAEISNIDIGDALGVSAGLGKLPFNGSVDADASLNISATAYVNQPYLRGLGGSSMGIRAQALAGASFTASVAVPTYSGKPIDLQLSPGATAEVSYVKPASGICRVGGPCFSVAPYYHENVTVRDLQGNPIYVVDQQQSDPFVIPRGLVKAIPTVPSLSPTTFGPITITPSQSVDAVFDVSGSISPVGAVLDLSMGLKASAQLTVAASTSALGETVSATATAKASLIDGHSTIASPWIAAETGATAHATAYLNAGYTFATGNRLCYGAAANTDISGVLGYSYSFDATATGPISTQKNLANDSAGGQSYATSVPVETCIQL